ncbi:MAG: SIS domain-containing protein [Promethearchaeota archaeon]|jgi:6-phospho 3-hexuloisomerase
MTSEDFQNRFHETMEEIANQVKTNANLSSSDSLINIVKAILQTHNQNDIIFVYGAGRSGFIGRCFAQRLMHLGIRSCFISDAVTYQYTKDDMLLLISGSGETTSTVAIALKAKQIGGKIVLFGSNPQSTIGKVSDLTIEIEGKSKDVAQSQESLAPYTSLFDISTLAVLDSIGGILMKNLGVTEADIDRRHASIE